MVSGTPSTIPGAPAITGVAPSNLQLTVAFTAAADGGSAITTYKYSTDGGVTWAAAVPAGSASPVAISRTSSANVALTNGAAYAVQLRAVNANGDGPPTASVWAMPAASPSVS